VPRAIPGDALARELTTLYANRAQDRILYFKADSSLSFGVAGGAIEVARRSGVRVLGAVAEQRPRRGK
jgi:hypothetical protein